MTSRIILDIGTITLTDDAGLSIQKTFNVAVVNSTVTLTTFAANAANFQVSYTVANANSAPFTISIYASSDGASPDTLLMSYAVTASGDLTQTTGTPHTVSFAAAFDDLAQDYHLIAVCNAGADPTANAVEFAGGMFTAQTATADPPQTIAYVFGTPGDDTIEVAASWLKFNGGAAFNLPTGVSEIHVRGEGGDDHLVEDSGVSVPVWYYGGDGHDTVTGEKYGDTIDLGDAGPPELRADGPTTVTEGQTATLTLQAALGNATISDWHINWGDGSYDTVTTTSPSHTYTTGSGVYTGARIN